jgi:hypothetical protein
VQQVETLVVGEERVGAMLKEEIDDVVVTSFRGPEYWCCDCISAFCVDVCAALDKEMAEGVVVVNCGPL